MSYTHSGTQSIHVFSIDQKVFKKKRSRGMFSLGILQKT